MIRKVWLIFSQLILLVIIFHAGNLITGFFQWKVPGNVTGMIILLGMLWLKIIKIEQIETTANWLLKHLGFFFIPISVGLMTLGTVILENGVLLLFILFISAFIGLITAGKTTQTVINRKDVKVNAHHDC